MCLDCNEVGELCDTCAFAHVRYKWLITHGVEAPYHLWWAARTWGGRHVLRQMRRQGWRYDAMVQRGPREVNGAV
jgi:hypothetical protein